MKKRKKTSNPLTDTHNMNSKQLAFACAQVACDAKASDIAIYDLRGTSSITDFAVVCTATSVPHLRAIMGDVDKEVWEKYEISPVYAERTPNALWCVLDYIDLNFSETSHLPVFFPVTNSAIVSCDINIHTGIQTTP